MDNYLGEEYTVIGHSGQTIAHSAIITSTPELKLGVVVLANSPGSGEELDNIAKKIMRLSLSIKTGVVYKKTDSENLAKIDKPFANFSGLYTSEFGLIEISGTVNNYQVDVMGSKFALNKDEQHFYSPKYKLFGLIPISFDELDQIKYFLVL